MNGSPQSGSLTAGSARHFEYSSRVHNNWFRCDKDVLPVVRHRGSLPVPKRQVSHQNRPLPRPGSGRAPWPHLCQRPWP